MKYKFQHGEMRIRKAEGDGGSGLPHNDIRIIRHNSGIPVIKALGLEDAYYGMGIMHAYDRMFQMWFVKVLSEGRAAEIFGDREDLINIDKYFRTLKFRSNGSSDKSRASDFTDNFSKLLNAYITGVEDFRKSGYVPFEFRVTGYKPEPWEQEDVFALSRIMAYVGLGKSGSCGKGYCRCYSSG
ncbi:MAG: hypothetical protein DRP57_02905 [Spirochaetes bacterium]|nr:MAG: hypothetical protein DRP57_02905 [Spirochaetota bacterium]